MRMPGRDWVVWAGAAAGALLVFVDGVRWWQGRERVGRPRSKPESPAVIEAVEPRAAAGPAAGEDEALRREVEALRAQVQRLSEALAAVRIEADVYKARLDREGVETAWRPAGDIVGALRVREVNADLRMVILDGGARQGLRNGMKLAVLQDDRPVARLIVVDVRTDVAGAVMDETAGRTMPKAGDRVIPARSE